MRYVTEHFSQFCQNNSGTPRRTGTGGERWFCSSCISARTCSLGSGAQSRIRIKLKGAGPSVRGHEGGGAPTIMRAQTSQNFGFILCLSVNEIIELFYVMFKINMTKLNH